jgi:HK97 gp10 family phage protein
MSDVPRRNLITKRPLSDAERKDLKLQANALEQAFKLKGIELDTLLKIGINEAAIHVESKAAMLAPVDKGLLRKSITHRIIDRDGYPVGQVGTNVEYAAWVEFGTGEFAEGGGGRKGGWSYKDEKGNWVFTRGNKPQPFLTPALNTSRSYIKTIISRRLKTAL